MNKEKNKNVIYPTLNPNRVEQVVNAVKNSLSNDLLKGHYKNPKEGVHPTTGHCYIATEACYYLLEGSKHGLVPCVAKDGADTHWWLKTPSGGRIDPTKEQYTDLGIEPPYENGKGCGFLTKEPSKRASIIMSRCFSNYPEILNAENKKLKIAK